jgi:cobalamin biosynthesis protein CobT
MSNFSVESKSQLVKLLAVENLTVEHQKIKTAKFDPKNRVLYLPIWQNMSGALYDLLGGHEVGHALYTPADGWHDAAQSKGKAYKSFLNVVEDARIEKKVKRRYPGLRKCFVDGYTNLIDRDFFGIKDEDINAMSFINRLNMFTKSGGTLGDNILGISFSAQEQILLKEVEGVETWEDVLRVTEKVWNYSKDEQFEMAEEFFDSLDDNDYDYDGEDDSQGSEDGDDEESEEENEEGDDSEGSSKSQENEDGKLDQDQKEKSPKSNGDNSEDSKEEKTEEETLTSSLNRYKPSKPVYDEFEPSCETDDSFRENEMQLLDDKCKEYVYIQVPSVKNMKSMVTPAKRVQEQLHAFYGKRNSYAEDENGHRANKLLNDFKKKNDRYIGLLAKEFEMRKAATRYAKAKISNTGDIDVNKVYKYQIDDSIFRKVMKIPKGKSHGLVLLLDKSSSMHRNMYSSIEQILILASFCRKVNIPFLVYGFGNHTLARKTDFPNEEVTEESGFTHNENEFYLNDCYLREYLNSSMSNAEWNASIKNMLLLMEGFAKGSYYSPNSELLSNTPLIESIIAIEPIINNFKQKNNLDIINTVIVHDGDSDSIHYTCEIDKEKDNKLIPKHFNTNSQNVYVVDKKSKFEMQIKTNNAMGMWDSHDALRKVIFQWLKHKTGTRIFGFFLIEGNANNMRGAIERRYHSKKMDIIRQKNYYGIKEECKLLARELKEKKFLESDNVGYDKFYLTPGGNELKIENEDFEVNGKVTANKLKTAFMKFNKVRQVNRVMVSKFIQGIAA